MMATAQSSYVKVHDLPRGAALTNHSYADIAQALGLDASKSRDKSKLCATRSRSMVKFPSNCPPYQTSQSTSDEAPSGSDDPPKCVPSLPRPTVDTLRHRDCSKGLEHHSNVDKSYAIRPRETSEVKSIGDAIGALSNHPSPEDEMESTRVESPNSPTREAVRHQDDSDKLFEPKPYESDSSDPTGTVVSPPSLVRYTGHDGRISDTRSTSASPWIQSEMQTTFTSQQDARHKGERLDKRSQVHKSENRTLRRCRSPHDIGRILVKRQRVDKTHPVVDHL